MLQVDEGQNDLLTCPLDAQERHPRLLSSAAAALQAAFLYWLSVIDPKVLRDTKMKERA